MLTISTGSADTMKVRLMALRNVQIHYQIDILCIDPTSCLKDTTKTQTAHRHTCKRVLYPFISSYGSSHGSLAVDQDQPWSISTDA